MALPANRTRPDRPDRTRVHPGTNSPHINLNGVGVGLAICFDVIFDDVIWQGAQDGAQLYLLQSNNGDFRGTDENLQQAAFARMRAIETGRSVVNVSTTGTSQAFAPTAPSSTTFPPTPPAPASPPSHYAPD
ncbi:nitrilase-related carbon-nitrogen hydrolase [Tessaracoccus coleopterorum]|uniref:nitrilase-related carbon-nitrogen hydrolase n=1 Tax=Tessaracoccus coleopterorum TaxID=2714950 RepID=UPI002F90A18B